MLHRQRALLDFLRLAGGHATSLQLTKWCFLMGRECSELAGPSFYEFLPYKYGPYSFCLRQEMEALAQQGFLDQQPSDSSWILSDLGHEAARGTPKALASGARQIHWKYGRRSNEELLDDVYARYPWFTINSERERLAARPSARIAVFTSGYEGLTVDGFLNRLLHSGIHRILDVRNNPVSRRYGFHKSTLARLAEKIGLQYVHLPELGIRSELRAELNTQADYDSLFAHYRATTLSTEKKAIKRTAELMRETASVLVCMEALPCQCHRSHLAESMASVTGLPVQHLCD
jgi:uncharacterized protein (DUF488 family)